MGTPLGRPVEPDLNMTRARAAPPAGDRARKESSSSVSSSEEDLAAVGSGVVVRELVMP